MSREEGQFKVTTQTMSSPVRLESAAPPTAYFESLFESFRKSIRDNDINLPEVNQVDLGPM